MWNPISSSFGMMNMLAIPYLLIQHSIEPKFPSLLVEVFPVLQCPNSQLFTSLTYVKISPLYIWLYVEQLSR